MVSNCWNETHNLNMTACERQMSSSREKKRLIFQIISKPDYAGETEVTPVKLMSWCAPVHNPLNVFARTIGLNVSRDIYSS